MDSTTLDISAYTFRKAIKEDIENILPLYRLLFELEADFQFDADKQRQGLGLLLDSTQSVVFIAELNGEIVGLCTMQTYISTAAGDYAGIVEDVVVAPRFRGLGLGSRMLTECETFARARGLKRLHLLMDNSNDLAVLFYNKNQWRPTQLCCLQKFID